MTLVEQLLSETKIGRQELLRQDLIVSVTEQIWAAMEAAGMNKAEVARALETSKANVTQLLSGQRNMTLSTLADLCAAVNAKPRVFISSAASDHVQLEAMRAEMATVASASSRPANTFTIGQLSGDKVAASVSTGTSLGATLKPVIFSVA